MRAGRGRRRRRRHAGVRVLRDGRVRRSFVRHRAAPRRTARSTLKIVGRALIGHRPRRRSAAARRRASRPARRSRPAPTRSCRSRTPRSPGETVRHPRGRRPRARTSGPPARTSRGRGARRRPGGGSARPELGLLANAGLRAPRSCTRARASSCSRPATSWSRRRRDARYGQVRDSNAYTLFAALREAGAMPVMAGIVRDDVEQLKETVLDYLIQADAFISSGGVSVGERDVVKAAFFRRGDVDFYRVAMQPGMPQGFGHIEGKPYFGLPGQPGERVRELRGVHPAGAHEDDGRAADLFRPEITRDARPRTSRARRARRSSPASAVRARQDGWMATPTGGRGSNLISTVARANGLAMIPPGPRPRPAGLAGPGHAVPLVGGLTWRATRRAPTASPGSSRSARRRDRPRGRGRVRGLDDAGGRRATRRRHAEGRPARGGEGRRRDGRQANARPAAVLPSDRASPAPRSSSSPTSRPAGSACRATVRATRPNGRRDGGAHRGGGRGAQSSTTPRRRSTARRGSRALRLLAKSGGRVGRVRAE